MVGPLLIFLLFGIIEFGLIVKDLVGVNQAAREGARAAIVGATPDTIRARVAAAAPSVNAGALQVTCEFRGFSESSNGWEAWQPLGVDGAENNADDGDQIRVSVQYPHQLVTGGLFAGVADSPGSGTITLSTAVIMQRE